MKELTPSARELVRAGRAASRPTLADRERVLHALHGRLADTGLPNDASSPATSTSLLAKGWLGWSGLGVVVLCGLGTSVFLTTGSAPDPQPTPAASAAAPAPNVAPEAPPVSPAAAPVKAEAAAPRGSSARTTDRLADEVAILSRAEADLHRGQASLALRALDEHQRKFPGGTLTLERRAARVRALCALGRAGEASAELRVLSSRAASSPLTKRARESCDRLLSAKTAKDSPSR